MKDLRMYRLPEFLESLNNTGFAESMRQGGFHRDADVMRNYALLQAEKCLVLVGRVTAIGIPAANDDRHPCVVHELRPGEHHD